MGDAKKAQVRALTTDLLAAVQEGRRQGLESLRDLLAEAIAAAVSATADDEDARAPKPEAIGNLARVLCDVLVEIESLGVHADDDVDDVAAERQRLLLAELPDPTAPPVQRRAPRSSAGGKRRSAT